MTRGSPPGYHSGLRGRQRREPIPAEPLEDDEPDDEGYTFVDWLTPEERLAADLYVSAGLKAALGSGMAKPYSPKTPITEGPRFGLFVSGTYRGAPCLRAPKDDPGVASD